MSILSVTEVWSGRSGGSNDQLINTYKKVFRVLTTNTLDGPGTAIAAVPVLRYQFYSEANGFVDLAARASNIEAAPDQDDPNTWLVTATFSTYRLQGEQAKAASKNDAQQDPLQRPTEIQLAYNRFSRSITLDMNGQAFVSSAREAFDPQPEVDDSRPLLSLTRNEPAPKFAFWISFRDKVNSLAWLGFPVGTAKCAGISATSAFEGNKYFWRVTYSFEINLTPFVPPGGQPQDQNIVGWDRFFFDWGTFYIDANGQVNRFRDKNYTCLAGKFCLNGKGGPLPLGDLPVFLGPFKMYQSADFAALKLP